MGYGFCKLLLLKYPFKKKNLDWRGDLVVDRLPHILQSPGLYPSAMKKRCLQV